MSSNSNSFALIHTASLATPPAEEIFFLEGIDGHAESVPSSEPDVIELDASNLLSIAGTDVSLASRDDEPFESELDVESEVEDPARTRRRKAARIGLAWGAVAMLAVAAVTASVHPRTDERSAALSASTPAARIETAQPPVAMQSQATSPTPVPALPIAASPPRPTLHATTASVTPSTPATSRRAVRAASHSSPAARSATRPASRSPKASAPRAKSKPAPSAKRPSPSR